MTIFCQSVFDERCLPFSLCQPCTVPLIHNNEWIPATSRVVVIDLMTLCVEQANTHIFLSWHLTNCQTKRIMKFRDFTEKKHLAKTQLPLPVSVLTVARGLIKGRGFLDLLPSLYCKLWSAGSACQLLQEQMQWEEAKSVPQTQTQCPVKD